MKTTYGADHEGVWGRGGKLEDPKNSKGGKECIKTLDFRSYHLYRDSPLSLLGNPESAAVLHDETCDTQQKIIIAASPQC